MEQKVKEITLKTKREKMKTIIEVDKKYKGYRYLVVGCSMGHRCGYVRIPKSHKLYGLSYSEQLPIKLEELRKEPIGKRGVITLLCNSTLKSNDNISMDLLFNVHGGITFSGEFGKGVNKNGWWIGFDCAHFGDGKDESLMDEKTKLYSPSMLFAGDVVRLSPYVEKECKRLINQIIKWFGKKKK